MNNKLDRELLIGNDREQLIGYRELSRTNGSVSCEKQYDESYERCLDN